MTDRIKGFTVTLYQDFRTDDVESIQKAIEMIKHVADVTPHVVTSEDHFERERIKYEMGDKIYKFIKENFYK